MRGQFAVAIAIFLLPPGLAQATGLPTGFKPVGFLTHDHVSTAIARRLEQKRARSTALVPKEGNLGRFSLVVATHEVAGQVSTIHKLRERGAPRVLVTEPLQGSLDVPACIATAHGLHHHPATSHLSATRAGSNGFSVISAESRPVAGVIHLLHPLWRALGGRPLQAAVATIHEGYVSQKRSDVAESVHAVMPDLRRTVRMFGQTSKVSFSELCLANQNQLQLVLSYAGSGSPVDQDHLARIFENYPTHARLAPSSRSGVSTDSMGEAPVVEITDIRLQDTTMRGTGPDKRLVSLSGYPGPLAEHHRLQ